MNYKTILVLFVVQLYCVNNTRAQITIDIFGNDTVYLDVLEEAYIEPGYKATDATGIDITNQVQLNGTIDTTKLGIYTLTYFVIDSLRIKHANYRRIIVRDTKKPIINTFTATDTVFHQIGTSFHLDDYIYVKDNYWNIPLSSLNRVGSVYVNQQGVYILKLNITDSSDNTADEFELFVWVREMIPPTLMLKGPVYMEVDVFSNFVDPGYVVTGGSSMPIVSIRVAPERFVTTLKLVTNIISYTAVDMYGNSVTKQRVVKVVDRQRPSIYLNGPNPLRLNINADFDSIDPGVVVMDNYWDKDSIIIYTDKSALNTSVIGSYNVYYSAQDKSGNISEQVTRVVEVTFPLNTNNDVSSTSQLSIYPNPSNGTVNISGGELIGSTVTILDITGRQVIKMSVDSNATMTSFDMSAYKQGMYHLQVENKGRVYRSKFSVIK